MKRLVMILGSALVAVTLVTTGIVIHARLNQYPQADLTANVNVMLTRPANWRQLDVPDVLDERDTMLIDGSTATIPITAELLRQLYGYSDEEVRDSAVVQHSTTHTAYVNLIDRITREKLWGELPERTTGLILVTPPSAEEEAYAAAAGVDLDLDPVALDGFVFITHKDNPVETLTVEQVRGIYSGQITNWSQVGGEDREIIAYQREANSGSQTAMERLVMDGRAMMEPSETTSTEVTWGMGQLVDAVAEYDNGPAAIGYTYNYYLANLYRNEAVKVLAIESVPVTPETLRQGDYPFSTAYYAVMRSDEPADSPARALRDFLLSPTGQDLVEMAGYVKAVN